MISLELAEEAMTRRGRIAQEIIALEKPDLIDLFLTYQNEALAARKFLQPSLEELKTDSDILEIGGGILALAIQLASEGFKVTTVEPVGEGFAEINYLMNLFSEIAYSENLEFELKRSPIEDCTFDHKFDFIFSINVMEHLNNPYVVLAQLVELLKQGAKYQFICPNYNFPYEPHFGKWLYSRKDGAFFMGPKRAISSSMPALEAEGLYRSLNFISFSRVIEFSKLNNIQSKANPQAFYNLLLRVVEDPVLAKRHNALSLIVKLVFLLKLHHISKLVPKKFQPIMEVEFRS